MRTETYKWIVNSLSDKENLSSELGGNSTNMTEYQDNMEILRTRNDINSSTNENLQ